MECKDCGSTQIVLRKDKRGLPEATCGKCGKYIRKMSTSEVMEYYEVILANEKGEAKPVAFASKEREKAPCKYCTEEYLMRRKQAGLREAHVPVEIKFCPICGRKVKESDRKY